MQIDMISHNYDTWRTVIYPTNTEPGLRRHICSMCGAHDAEEVLPVNPHEHIWSGWVENVDWSETVLRNNGSEIWGIDHIRGYRYCEICLTSEETDLPDKETLLKDNSTPTPAPATPTSAPATPTSASATPTPAPATPTPAPTPAPTPSEQPPAESPPAESPPSETPSGENPGTDGQAGGM